MKRGYFALLLALVVSFTQTSCSRYEDRTIVILSTNDIHSQINKFPELATAIEMCRDTAAVILVDAGDKVTGNAYVDNVEYYTPLYELMNELEYDLSIFGNHEFDKGAEYIAKANEQADFLTLGANIKSADEVKFPQPVSHTIIERNGLKIGFVGVVNNPKNGYPVGKNSNYEAVTFISPEEAAAKYSHLKEECDMFVLVSHSGLTNDRKYAKSKELKVYDMIIGGHSHDKVSEEVNGIQIIQSGSRLSNIGVTAIDLREGQEPKVTTKVVPLSTYAKDEKIEKMIEKYRQNPALQEVIGEAALPYSELSVNNFVASTIRRASKAEIGFYNVGGIRVDKFDKGDIKLSTILDLEPFGETIHTVKMTRDQMRILVMAKYNDMSNPEEAHKIDLVSSTPYIVITNNGGDARDILFPVLKPEQVYTVALNDYVFSTYKGLEYTDHVATNIPVAKALEDHIRLNRHIYPDWVEYQIIR